ncbi:unnamed protein product [Lupinus luteus]|uniref:B-like cyclin n=1 Tax=Lupinus luteus TaxID=3873 RepID=A0AAV1X3S1_LUPLU
MAIHHHQMNDQLELQQQHNENVSSVLDALYCDEVKWEEEEDDDEGKGEFSSSEESDVTTTTTTNNDNGCLLFPLLLLEQDLFCEDEELNSLFSKEKNEQKTHYSNIHSNINMGLDDSALCVARREAFEWILKVNGYYGFSSLTATLAFTYLDRFLSSFHFQREKPWMIHLVAVTCISLAAKVEETQVPLLLDLQVQDAKYVFEAKTIQRMELLVLSTLKWKMHPVTPLSFIDHIIRRLGLKTNLHWEFLRRCEQLLLSMLLDSRFVGCLPSVLATATMLHVIDQIGHGDGLKYKTQLLSVLKISKEKVDECYNAILHLIDSNANNYGNKNPLKRKYDQIPDSPSGVIDASFISDGSNDSWVVGSSLYSSPETELLLKKNRTQGQLMKLSPHNRVIV